MEEEYKLTHTGPEVDSGVARALPGGAIDLSLSNVARALPGGAIDLSLSNVARALAGGEIDQLRPNRNLLDNWDFRNPVNQRGQTSYTTADYTIDRFQKMTNVGSATVAISGLVITGCGTGANLSQTIENPELFAGKTVTLSVRGNRTGNSFYITERINNNYALSQNLIIPNTFGIASIMFTLPQTLTDFAIQFSDFDASDTATIQSVKLELGSVSTLANDPPADYGIELLKCQRYFQTFKTQPLRPTDYRDFRPIMRTNPVLSTITVGADALYTASADL